MIRYVGRTQPYTARGIARVPCAACGEPSAHQWSVCANGNRFLGVCNACDYAVNAMALDFFSRSFPPVLRDYLLSQYARKVRMQS